MSYNYLFKLIIIGDTGVGKSCVLLQFIDKRFRQKHEITIGVEFGARQLELDGKQLKIQIWDTAGQESFKSITRQYYRGAAGALIVYDITSRQSYSHIKNWLEEAKTHGNPQLSFILVGNKSDNEEERQVSFQEAQEFAQQQGLEFLETSAKNGINVEEVFLKLSLSILQKIEDKQIDPKNESFGVKVGKAIIINKDQQNQKIKVNSKSLSNKKEQSKCC